VANAAIRYYKLKIISINIK